MRRAISAAALAAGLLGFGAGAHAACDSGTPDAKAVAYTVADEDSGRALGFSIRMAYLGEIRRYDKHLTTRVPACNAATFAIGSLHYTLHADDGSVWPRSATGANRSDPHVVLMATPKPDVAMHVLRATTVSMAAGGGITYIKLKPEDIVYVLVAGPGDDKPWSVYGMFDRIPDTPRLAQLMCQAVIGSLPVAAEFRMTDTTVTFKDVSALAAMADRGHDGGPCTVQLAP
ncbi:MAG TPA: hypothetical protein VJ476_04845 [Rhizomicrobium sp.]|nr:hypothetical protein [Rhizomicrobium sp.]